jgi:hypothetical protein
MPPVNGFSIKTSEGKFLSDIRPRGIVRELNRLNDRINKLEEAGDVLHENSYPTMWDSPEVAALKMVDQSNWTKAKEAKP